jgi:RND family efflux transporter MFP subunit
VTDPQNKFPEPPESELAAFAVEIEVTNDQKHSARKWWALLGLGLIVLALAGGYCLTLGKATSAVSAEEPPPDEPVLAVEVVHPTLGGAERTTTQPATVESYESAQLFAQVSGVLDKQTVDIGDYVTKGQVLAKVAVPDLDKQVDQYRAAVEQARARVRQMKAHLVSARADLETAKAVIVQAEAKHKSTQASRRYRQKQYTRLAALGKTGTIEAKIVDEEEDRYTAAIEAENAAAAAVVTAQAQKTAAEAKIDQAIADVGEAEAQVGVQQALLGNAEVKVRFATITSPYTGVITQRSLVPGNFVRAATEGGSQPPLLTVARTDKVRVVVQIPDRDVSYADPGDPATVEIDALGGQRFQGKVSRMSNAEDPQTRTMRVEIDLDNPQTPWWWGSQRELRQGMYGSATILLDRFADLVSIPSSCLVGKSEGNKASVYVVTEDNHLRLLPVIAGSDNGLRIVITKGLTVTDRVVQHPSSELADGLPVRVSSTSTEQAPRH